MTDPTHAPPTGGRLGKLPRVLLEEIRDLLSVFILHFPGRTGIALRAPWFRWRVARCGSAPNIGTGADISGGSNIRVGDGFIIRRGVTLAARGGEIQVGDHCAINTNSCIVAAGGGRIVLGNHVIMAMNVVVRAADHRYSSIDVPIRYQGH